MPLWYLSHYHCKYLIAGGRLCTIHALPLTGSQCSLPSGPGCTGAFQSLSGQDQPEPRLPGGGSRKVQECVHWGGSLQIGFRANASHMRILLENQAANSW